MVFHPPGDPTFCPRTRWAKENREAPATIHADKAIYETRLEIIKILKKGPIHFGELCDRLTINNPTLINHLKYLEKRGFKILKQRESDRCCLELKRSRGASI